MKSYFTFLFLIINLICLAQIQISSTTVNGFNTASEGDLYIDETNVYYIGLADKSLKEIGIVTQSGTSNGDVLSWNTNNNQWEPDTPANNALQPETETINCTRRSRISIAQEIINNSSFTITPESISFDENGIALNANAITTLQGNLRFWVQVNFNSSQIRTNFNVLMRVNGVDYKRVFGSAYIRISENNNEASARYIFEYENAETADEFDFILESEANTADNNVSIRSNSSILIEASRPESIMTSLNVYPNFNAVQGPTGPQGPTGNTGNQGVVIGDPTDVYHAAGRVTADGIALYIQGASIIKTGTGRYTVTFNTPYPTLNGNFPVIFSMEQNTGRDDYQAAYVNANANGFDVEIGEHDTGTDPSIPQDAGFSFYIPLTL